MKHKQSVVLALLFLLCTATTCYEDDDRVDYPIALTGIKDLEHLDNTGDYPCLPTDGVVSRQAYMLKISLDFDYIEEFINEGYHYYVLKDTITTVQIISLHSYDESHQAGTDVSGMFVDYPLSLGGQLKDYSRTIDGSIFYKVPLPGTLPQAGVHKFKVVIKTTAGKEFTAETDEITLEQREE
ncbi:DUF5034 domain-containing protein [Bacteroides sp. UBA939]|uniref:DUF5034 domain-containing protein n=1 Tax=Bacteroides sp. UBA939 TaxID=1946092 RepID=UPI0025C334CC|nr:DUF5034 domain-containing protein [Bacteroides sp. UBA939]